jgi:hypothetical protein
MPKWMETALIVLAVLVIYDMFVKDLISKTLDVE